MNNTGAVDAHSIMHACVISRKLTVPIPSLLIGYCDSLINVLEA